MNNLKNLHYRNDSDKDSVPNKSANFLNLRILLKLFQFCQKIRNT